MLLAVLPPVSNRADWIQAIEVRDESTNALIDLSAYTIEMALEPVGEDGWCCGGPVLTATTDDGTITLPFLGQFEFHFTAAQMYGGCAPSNYRLGITATLAGFTTQLIIGTVPVLEGVVR